MIVAQPMGRCGPCCSQVPTGTIRRGSAAITLASSAGCMSLRRRGEAAAARRGEVISNRGEVQPVRHPAPTAGGWTHLWTLLAGVALVAGAWWLRSPSLRYVAAAA